MDELSEYQQLCLAVGELLVHVGVMGAASESFPEEVKENWEEKVKEIKDRMNQDIEEIQHFGEYFDDH